MRQPVPLPKSYRLLNHGPTTLITSSHGGRSNVMAAAWIMPLDLDPARIAFVLAEDTYTRTLVDASGLFAVNVPSSSLAQSVYDAGQSSGRDEDKIARLGLRTFAGPATGVPLVEGCLAWLECRVLPESHLQDTYDLFLGEVVGAWADDRRFREGRWIAPPDTLHHIAGGEFLVPGGSVTARTGHY